MVKVKNFQRKPHRQVSEFSTKDFILRLNMRSDELRQTAFVRPSFHCKNYLSEYCTNTVRRDFKDFEEYFYFFLV